MVCIKNQQQKNPEELFCLCSSKQVLMLDQQVNIWYRKV